MKYQMTQMQRRSKMPRYQLGRQGVKTDPRSLKLEKYTAALPAPPASVSFTRGIAEWGALGNILYGDCTIAGALHILQVWIKNAINEMQNISFADAIHYYSIWDGYV